MWTTIRRTLLDGPFLQIDLGFVGRSRAGGDARFGSGRQRTSKDLWDMDRFSEGDGRHFHGKEMKGYIELHLQALPPANYDRL